MSCKIVSSIISVHRNLAIYYSGKISICSLLTHRKKDKLFAVASTYCWAFISTFHHLNHQWPYWFCDQSMPTSWCNFFVPYSAFKFFFCTSGLKKYKVIYHINNAKSKCNHLNVSKVQRTREFISVLRRVDNVLQNMSSKAGYTQDLWIPSYRLDKNLTKFLSILGFELNYWLFDPK